MSLSDALGFNGRAPATPAKLVENALGTFQRAQDEMKAAQAAIEGQQQEHRQAIADAQAKLDDAQEQHDRLSRVAGKLNDLLA